LSKEIILKIKETEATAQKIRSDAATEAAERIKNAEANGKKLCEKAQADAERTNSAKLKIASSRADEVVESARADAENEANAARESAEFNIREAVRLIIAGVYEQCQ